MATGLASGVANSLLAALCKATNYTAPTGFYVKLHTGDPGSAGTSNAAGNTTRQSVTFAAASGGSIASSADVTWTSVSTAETYSHASFWSASSSGTFIGSCAFTASKTVAVGDTATIPSTDLTLSLSPVAA